MYCCQPLENKIADAGQRGSAVLVERAPEGFAFWLQSRGVAYRDEAAFRDVGPLPPPAALNVSHSQRIAYCPWCGRRLADLAAADPERFARLAAKHAHLVPVGT